MATANKEKHGALFQNHAVNPHPKAPSHRGTCTLFGETYYISAWSRTTSKGAKFPNERFLSLKFDLAEDGEEKPTPQPQPPPPTADRVDVDRDQETFKF
jgi:hypothetical protein